MPMVEALVLAALVAASLAHSGENLRGRAHDPRRLLYKSFAFLVLGFHPEGAHMEDDGVDLSPHEELHDLWHLPRLGLLRMFVDEMSLGADLHLVDLDTEPHVCFSVPEFLRHNLRISLGSSNFL